MASFLRRKEALSRIYNSILHSKPSSLHRHQPFRSTFPSQSSNNYLFRVSAHPSFSKVPFLTIPFCFIYRILSSFSFLIPTFSISTYIVCISFGSFLCRCVFFSITLSISHPCEFHLNLYYKSINGLIASYI